MRSLTLLLAATLLALPAAAPRAHAAEPLLAATGTAPAQPIDPARLAALPRHTATAANHGFAGPLLWDVLVDAHLVDPARHADAPRQTLRLTGADGYTAIIALGEISPEFEDKPALLALEMDGHPLALPRATIPGDKRGGRGVHDIVRLTVDELPATKH